MLLIDFDPYIIPGTMGGGGSSLPADSAGYLQNDGSGNLVWDAAATPQAAGADTQVQYNDGGTITAGAAGLLYDKTAIDLTVKDIANDANAGSITFLKARTTTGIQAGQDADLIGSILFKSYNDKATPELITFASIVGSLPDASDGTEDGCIDFNVLCQGTWRRAMRITKDTNDFYGVSIGDPVIPLAALHVDSTSLDFIYAAKIVNTIVNRAALYVEGPTSGWGINSFGGTAVIGNCAGQGGVGINAVVATNYDGHAFVATRNAGNAMGTIGDYPLAIFQVSDQMGATSSLMRLITDCYNVGSTDAGYILDILHYQTPLYRHTSLNVINHYNYGTAPTAIVANAVQMWSADYAAGDARLYIMGEKSTNAVIIGDGKVIASGVELSAFTGAQFEAIADTSTPPARDVMFDYQDVGTATTWSTTDKSAEWTLAGSNLHAERGITNIGSWRGIRSSVGIASGLKYLELTYVSGTPEDNGSFGFATDAASLTNYVGSGATGWGITLSDGKAITGGSGVAYNGGVMGAAGTVYGIAINMTTGKWWVRNATGWINGGDPAAGTGEAHSGLSGTLYLMLSEAYNSHYTVNFGMSAFSYSIPTGFVAWDVATYKITGEITGLANVKQLNFSPLALDDHECRGDFFYSTCGETTTLFQTVYRKSDSKFWLTDANAAATMPGVALASAAMTADATGQKYLVRGWARDASWSWTVGGLIYASETPGTMTQTAPTTSGAQVQILGWALTAEIIRFDPQLVIVEV